MNRDFSACIGVDERGPLVADLALRWLLD